MHPTFSVLEKLCNNLTTSHTYVEKEVCEPDPAYESTQYLVDWIHRCDQSFRYNLAFGPWPEKVFYWKWRNREWILNRLYNRHM